jgi:hypothetical protein
VVAADICNLDDIIANHLSLLTFVKIWYKNFKSSEPSHWKVAKIFLTSVDGHTDCWNILWPRGDGARWCGDRRGNDDATLATGDNAIDDDDARDDNDDKTEEGGTANNAEVLRASKQLCLVGLAGGDEV